MENEKNFEMKPDYYANDTVLEITDSFKDDFYPLSAARAKILFNLGLPIYELCADEIKSKIQSGNEFVGYGFYGIYKDVWELFLRTKSGEDFVQVWGFVSDTAQYLKGDMLVNVENGAGVSEEYEEVYAQESSCIENYFDERENDEFVTEGDFCKKAELYLMPLVFEYAERLYDMFDEAGARVNQTNVLIELLASVSEDLAEYKQ